MAYFTKIKNLASDASKQIMGKVGIPPILPPDKEIEICRKKLETLEKLRSNVKQSFEQYSNAILSLSASGIALSKQITKIYKKSHSRQKDVAGFKNAQSTIDVAATELFKERFGWEILKKFDDWEVKIQKLQHLLNKVEQARLDVAIAEANRNDEMVEKNIQSQKTKKITFKPNRLGFSNRGNIILRVDPGGQADKAGVRKGWRILEINGVPHRNNDLIHSEIERIKRNGEYLIILFSITHATNQEANQHGKLQAVFKKMRQSLKTQVIALVAERFRIFDGCFQYFITLQATIFKLAAKELDQCKFEGRRSDNKPNKPRKRSTSTPYRYLKGQPKILPSDSSNHSPSDSNESLNDQGTNGNENNRSTIDSKRCVVSDEQIGLFPLIPPPPSDATDKINFNRQDQSAIIHNPVENILDFSSVQNQNNDLEHESSFMTDIFSQTPAVNSEPSIDFFNAFDYQIEPDIEPDNIPSQEPEDILFPGMELYNSNGQNQNSKLADSRLQFVYDLNRKDEEYNEAKIDAYSRLDEKIAAWQYSKNGTKNDIRTLLSTLDKLLWKDAKWKKPSLSDMLDDKGIKKKYRKAILLLHPDRLKDKNPDIVVTGERAFDIINTAWQNFQKEPRN